MGRKSDWGVLHRFAFPPYAVRAVNRTDLLVCGGGGAAKTGVPNQLQVLRLRPVPGGVPEVQVLCETSTDPFAVMNLDVLSFDSAFRVFTGQGDHCLEYHGKVESSLPNGRSSPKEAETTVRQRRNRTSNSESGGGAGNISCILEAFRRVRTDPTCQNVVRVSPTGEYLCTGGADGVVRVYSVTELRTEREIKAHEGEIADLDVAPNGSRLCTVAANAKEKYAVLWRLQDGSRVVELALSRPTGGIAYRFKHCRYGRLMGSLRRPGRKKTTEGASVQAPDGVNFVLYTTHIPVTRAGPRAKPAPCYVTAWDCVRYREHLVAPVGTEIVSALSVSDEGRYLALGTIEGSVIILTAFNLSRLYYLPEAHSIFVTAIDFLPAGRANKEGNDCEVVSVSADNILRWHRVPRRAEYSWFFPLLGAVLIIYAFFYAISELAL